MKYFGIKVLSLVLLLQLFNLSIFANDNAVGEKVYQQACAMCHTSGVASAPVLGKKDQWTERSKKETSELYASAINGLGAMPAKGGQVKLSDAEVSAAVDYMLQALEQNEKTGIVKESDSPEIQDAPVILNAQQEKGKELAFDRSKGNCLSCHLIQDGDFPGNSGPALMNMKVRFPDKQVLRSQIYDATIRNPGTIMIPYGRHQILTDEEIDLITNYIHAL